MLIVGCSRLIQGRYLLPKQLIAILRENEKGTFIQ